MSFAHEIKLELLNQELSTKQGECLVYGLLSASKVNNDGMHTIKMRDAGIFKTIINLLEQLSIKFTINPKHRLWIDIQLQEEQTIKHPSYFFGGAFICGGSISDLETTSYHLEIQFNSKSEAQRSMDFLNKRDFNFNVITRRNMYVLYIKKSSQIADFLRAVNAFNGLLSFEDIRIERDYKNQLNRYSNLDFFNQEKLVKAHKSFSKRYKYIEKTNLIYKFRDIELLFFKLKIKNPYLSLVELTELFNKKNGTNFSKSALNHWLIKLRNITGIKK